jgi:hypothetical protein
MLPSAGAVIRMVKLMIRMFNPAIKSVFRAAGLTVSRRDILAESIARDYNRSPYLDRIYRNTVERLLYFEEMVDRTRSVEGDVVECGVSTGYGLLSLILLSEIAGVARQFHGFDSFQGMPPPTTADRNRLDEGDYASTPTLVERVLRDGRISDASRAAVHLHVGMFHETLPDYRRPVALVHLDCDFYESYKTCLEHLYQQVVPGGVILFDEYQPDFPGAIRAIDEFFTNRPERVEIHDRFRKGFVVKV